MADPSRLPHALIVCTVFCLLKSVVCMPKPNATSAGLNLVLYPEELKFGRFAGPTDILVEKKSPPIIVDKQLHVRCFQELRSERNGTNVTDGFYVRTGDSLYGKWTIRAKLPSNIQAALRIELRTNLMWYCTDDWLCDRRIPPTANLDFSLRDPSQMVLNLHGGNWDSRLDLLPKYTESFQTYEFIWKPDSFELRINGRVAAGFFDPRAILKEPMALYISANCDNDRDLEFDETSGFVISSLTYTPFLPPSKQRKASAEPLIDLVVQHEYLSFGEEFEEGPLGFDKFLMDDLSAVLVDKQLRIRCF